MGGIMSVTGFPHQPPARVGISVGDITAGLYLAIGINGALYQRAATGVASKIDIAMLDCQVAIMEDNVTVYAKTGEIPGPLGTRHPSIAPFQAFTAADGQVIIAAATIICFSLMANALGRSDLLANRTTPPTNCVTRTWTPSKRR